MSRMTKILAVFLLCISLCACSSNNGSTAKAIVNELCSSKYQGRVSGSEGNIKAAEYIADFFEEQGLEPYFDSYYHEFDGTVLQPELSKSQVAIISPDGKKTTLKPGYDYTYSLPIKDIDFTLPVSDNADECKDGTKAFITSDVASASQFISQNPLAVAIIDEDEFRSDLYKAKPESGFRITLKSEYVQQIKDSNSQLSVKVKASSSSGTLKNVISVLRGSEGKNATIITAHFDGSGFCGERIYPSALDNASGAATMMRIAELVKASGTNLKNDVIFAAFNGEETGFTGSSAFSAVVNNNYDTINLINIDCVGLKEENTLLYADESKSMFSVVLAEALSQQPFVYETHVSNVYSPSDHIQFYNVPTIASIGIHCGSSNLFHTFNDLPENLDYDVIEDIATQIADFVVKRGDEKFVDTTQLQEKQSSIDEQVEVFWDGLNKQRIQLIEENELKYNEGICVAARYPGDSEDNKFLLYGMRYYDNLAELEELFPFINLPEQLGNYSFEQAAVRLEHRPSEYADTSDIADNYILGERYTFEIKPENLQMISADYKTPDGKMVCLQLYIGREGFPSDSLIDAENLDPVLADIKLFCTEGNYSLAKYMDGDNCLLLDFCEEETISDPTAIFHTESKPISEDELVKLLKEVDVKTLAGTLIK